jgi:hypothetical protein
MSAAGVWAMKKSVDYAVADYEKNRAAAYGTQSYSNYTYYDKMLIERAPVFVILMAIALFAIAIGGIVLIAPYGIGAMLFMGIVMIPTVTIMVMCMAMSHK